MMEGMQEARKALAMAETAQKNMLKQLADRDREMVKLRDTLEGMEVRASKAERQVVKLHLAEKERNTSRLLMAFVEISCVAICALNTLCPQHHNSIKQEARVVPIMPINAAWRRLGGGISATTGEHNDPENGNNPVLGSAGSTPSSGANAEIDCFAHMSERMQKQMKEMAKELKQVQATQQRDHAQMRLLLLLMEKYGSEVEEKQQGEKQDLSNETEATPDASRLRVQGLAGRIARTLSSMQQVIAGKKATAECDGGTQREADSTKKHQLKEPLEQHYEQHMDAEQDNEGAQRHTDGTESKWCMVLEREADVQTFDEQISEIHTAEHRAATISVAGEHAGINKTSLPTPQWESLQVLTHSGEKEVQDDNGHINLLLKGADREAILTTAILAIMIVAACRTAAEGCLWLGVIDSLIFLIIWHEAVVLTRTAWMGSWFWKQELRLHNVTWACEAITSMAHLLPLLMALGHLVLYCGYSGDKITVSKLGLSIQFLRAKEETGAWSFRRHLASYK
jgi:hypothetical protein